VKNFRSWTMAYGTWHGVSRKELIKDVRRRRLRRCGAAMTGHFDDRTISSTINTELYRNCELLFRCTILHQQTRYRISKGNIDEIDVNIVSFFIFSEVRIHTPPHLKCIRLVERSSLPSINKGVRIKLTFFFT